MSCVPRNQFQTKNHIKPNSHLKVRTFKKIVIIKIKCYYMRYKYYSLIAITDSFSFSSPLLNNENFMKKIRNKIEIETFARSSEGQDKKFKV